MIKVENSHVPYNQSHLGSLLPCIQSHVHNTNPAKYHKLAKHTPAKWNTLCAGCSCLSVTNNHNFPSDQILYNDVHRINIFLNAQ